VNYPAEPAAILEMVGLSRFAIVSNRLDLPGLVDAALAMHAAAAGDNRQPGPGAAASFLGVVRNENAGRRVVRLEYEAYAPLALATFERVGREVASRWPDVVLAVHHRVGRLEIGEASVAIVAASTHRGEAFGACRYAIERIKQIAPIWKRELTEDGAVWVEGATADPDDARAVEEAWRRACA
jgi:molybdopterin synthase catalytic subunit